MTFNEIKEKYEGSEILFSDDKDWNWNSWSKKRIGLSIQQSKKIQRLFPVIITNYIHFLKYGRRHGQGRKETKIIR